MGQTVYLRKCQPIKKNPCHDDIKICLLIANVDLLLLDALLLPLILWSRDRYIRSVLYVSKLFIDYHLNCIVIYPTEATVQVRSSPQAAHW